MIRRIVIIAALLLPPVGAMAVSNPAELLPDQAQEQRAERIGKELRCVVCQNQSVEDSDSAMARDLRQIVRQKVAAGDTDAAIRQWMVARYGDFILLKPPLSPLTYLLWGSPLIGLVAASAIMMLRPRSSAPAPLTPEERARIEHLAARK